MPTVHVTRRITFNAAHRLHNPARSDEWNRATFGKCNHPHWHGHNYVLEVTVAGEPDPETGYVIDLAALKTILEARVVDDLDHRNLNLDVPWLEGMLPSTENLAVAIWGRLADHLPGPARLAEIRLQETENNSAVYRG
ncbi:MAG TPA: 6-carboxytetrahydropterin synthase, partial [Rhodothermales bacterium]|nr:6-carboxytetrahydropterin synthase [Rhodothermales bacterium]